MRVRTGTRPRKSAPSQVKAARTQAPDPAKPALRFLKISAKPRFCKDSKYRPCPLLVKYVEAGWLGRKVKRGFYDYRGVAPVPTR